MNNCSLMNNVPRLNRLSAKSLFGALLIVLSSCGGGNENTLDNPITGTNGGQVGSVSDDDATIFLNDEQELSRVRICWDNEPLDSCATLLPLGHSTDVMRYAASAACSDLGISEEQTVSLPYEGTGACLQVATDADSLDTNNIAWEIENQCGDMDIVFHRLSEGEIAGFASEVTSLDTGELETFELTCNEADQLCFGASVSEPVLSTLGLGLPGNQFCTDCCFNCGLVSRKESVLECS